MRKSVLLISAMLLLFVQSYAQTKRTSPKKKFRVVGYYSLKSAMNTDLEKVPFHSTTQKSFISKPGYNG